MILLHGWPYDIHSYADVSALLANQGFRVIVPYPAGGGTDIIGRLISSQLSQHWGQGVIVENKPGAGGNADTSKPGTAGTETLSKTGAQTLLLAVTACIMLAAGFSITTARSRRR